MPEYQDSSDTELSLKCYEDAAVMLVVAFYGLLDAASRCDGEDFAAWLERLSRFRRDFSDARAGHKVVLDARKRQGRPNSVECCGTRATTYGDIANNIAAAIETRLRYTPPSMLDSRPRGADAVCSRLDRDDIFGLVDLIRFECQDARNILQLDDDKADQAAHETVKDRKEQLHRTANAIMDEDSTKIMAIGADNNKSVDDRMREICGIDRRMVGNDSEKWASMLVLCQLLILGCLGSNAVSPQSDDAGGSFHSTPASQPQFSRLTQH